MANARTDYKEFIRKRKYDYDNKNTEILAKNRHKNAREYWKLLKGLASQNNASETLDSTDFLQS